jgi:hypothetical protein
MTEIKRLIRIDHDNMENRDAIVKTCLATFIGSNSSSKLEKYLKELGRIEMYLGWDGQIYPKFEIKVEYAR